MISGVNIAFFIPVGGGECFFFITLRGMKKSDFSFNCTFTRVVDSSYPIRAGVGSSYESIVGGNNENLRIKADATSFVLKISFKTNLNKRKMRIIKIVSHSGGLYNFYERTGRP